jgi:hypothetical protein
MKKPCRTGAARAIENSADSCLTAHASPRQLPPPSPRLRGLAAQLHSLGERPLFEFLLEVSRGANPRGRLERYARLAPLTQFSAANDGDRASPLRVVRGQR